MKLDGSSILKSAAIGVAVAVILIVFNGVNYAVQDLKSNLNLGWQLNNVIDSLGNYSTYFASVVAGLVLGIIVVWACKNAIKSLSSIIIFPLIAGLVMGVICLLPKIGYELILRPIIRGWTISPINAITTILYTVTDIGMMIGLAIAGGVICAVFLLKREFQ